MKKFLCVLITVIFYFTQVYAHQVECSSLFEMLSLGKDAPKLKDPRLHQLREEIKLRFAEGMAERLAAYSENERADILTRFFASIYVFNLENAYGMVQNKNVFLNRLSVIGRTFGLVAVRHEYEHWLKFPDDDLIEFLYCLFWFLNPFRNYVKHFEKVAFKQEYLLLKSMIALEKKQGDVLRLLAVEAGVSADVLEPVVELVIGAVVSLKEVEFVIPQKHIDEVLAKYEPEMRKRIYQEMLKFSDFKNAGREIRVYHLAKLLDQKNFTRVRLRHPGYKDSIFRSRFAKTIAYIILVSGVYGSHSFISSKKSKREDVMELKEKNPMTITDSTQKN